jgi:type IV secretory pathway VirB10-like protein
MSTDRPEFRPVEAAPAHRAWPYAVVGIAVVAAGLWLVQRNVASAAAPRVTLADAAARTESKAAPAADAAKPAMAKAEADKASPAKPPESPNVLGSAVSAASKLAMVAKSELDRELLRTKGAQKQAATYKKQIDDLQKQLTEARGQIAAFQRAQQPPPPTDQEQILQMLAPVLRGDRDGRP